ncbi:MAG: ABC transporter ATP-binding protein [Armatimonadota bacterium]|nr:ABC transporter ATP-binding protein [Armatimonadota bacterium]
MTLLEVEDLTVYHGKALTLDRLCLYVAAGEVVAVLGPNGAGKTTLLRAICRVLPAQGVLRFLGRDLLRVPPHQVAALGIAHCPERRRLFGELSVEKNLLLGAYSRSDREVGNDLRRVYELFPLLHERRRQLAGTLSGGQQQMLAIARALMGRPRLLLLDEPSTGLAPAVRAQIGEAVLRARAEGIGVLLVEQDASFALRISDRGYVLESGRLVLEGNPSSLRDNPHVREVYLGIA